MAKFKVCVRPNTRRSDGFYAVYVRVSHNRKIGYIRTDKIVNDEGLNRGEVCDPFVLQTLGKRVAEWADALNRVDIEAWSVQDALTALSRKTGNLIMSPISIALKRGQMGCGLTIFSSIFLVILNYLINFVCKGI